MTAKTKRNNSTTTEQPRRANKPLMEKRRRARINQSLAALKALILDSAKQDNTKHSKLEKADILELTVRHFQRHRSLETPGIHQYRAGYSDCVKEVQRYLETPDAHTMTVMDSGVKQRLLRHLDNCISEVDTDIRPQLPVQTPQAPPPTLIEDRLQPPDSSTIEEVNNNAAKNDLIVQQELKQQLPTKMVKTYDGSFVFVLPSHYLQLATALGINLRPQVEPQPPPLQNSSGEPSSPPPSVKEENIEEPMASTASASHLNQGKCEKPLDFSKNNDSSCDMWRPW
ncbi:Hairy Orange [Popillia japonica]|uniref:Hairy Orange n=1 Tax=Popillia japonica TaxID=7064 RepID=A0AAW1JZ56_POPJA